MLVKDVKTAISPNGAGSATIRTDSRASKDSGHPGFDMQRNRTRRWKSLPRMLCRSGLGRARLPAPVGASLALVALLSPAAAGNLEARYDISLMGFKIGVATLKAQIDGDRYDLSIWAKLTGLAGVMTGGKGAATATGSLTDTRPAPKTFAITTAGSEKSITVRMAMSGGVVQAVEINPEIEPHPDRIAVTDAHRRNVLDPVSALLMPVGATLSPANAASVGQSACRRTLPIFDGAARYDITLTPRTVRTIKGVGYQGPVAVCDVRYSAIAGHRANRKVTKFMEENRDMQVWLAPLAGTRLFMPYRISVRTPIGLSEIEATSLTMDGVPLGRDMSPVRAQN